MRYLGNGYGCYDFFQEMRVMFSLKKGQSIEEFLQNVRKSFDSGEVVYTLNRGLNNDISYNGIESIDMNYVKNAERIVMGFIHNNSVDSRWLSPISEYLTIKVPGEVYNKHYLGYIDESFFYNSLESIFFASVLGNDKIMGRFGVAYELWKNSVEIGRAGESKTLGRILPYYITYFGRRALLIDPIEGVVCDFDLKSVLGSFGKIESLIKELKDGKYYVRILADSGKWCNLAQASIFGEFDFEPLVDIKRNEKNKRRSNKGDNTKWQTCNLDHIVDGHNRTIRVHNLVALMVYGLECVKYTLMEGNSILTVDHINGIHNDNRVDNLQLLTRKSNEDKREGKDYYYYDYFDLWVNRIPKARKFQDDKYYRMNTE